MNRGMFGNKLVSLATEKTDKNIWSTKKVDKYLYDLENGNQNDMVCPFFDKKLGYRKANLIFKYTDEEKEEIRKCMNDIVYFANTYCYAMTDHGIEKIKLRAYQTKVLRELSNPNKRFHAFLASRQVGKCFFPLTYIYIKDKNGIKNIPIFRLYFNILKKERKLKILELVHYFLYNILFKLETYYDKKM